MAVRTHEEILRSIRERFDGDTSDETIEFLEDVDDTFKDYENKISDKEDWKTKYEENDREWREKYKERFFSSDDNTKDVTEEIIEETKETETKPKTFDDLFKTEE